MKIKLKLICILQGLFNLRGSDIPYNPMFFAYAIINADNTEPHK